MRIRALPSAASAPGRLEAVELTHADVHQDNRWTKAHRLVYRLTTAARLGHHLDVVLAGEQHAKSGTDHRLIVLVY
jgi:hypothetical protein